MMKLNEVTKHAAQNVENRCTGCMSGAMIGGLGAFILGGILFPLGAIAIPISATAAVVGGTIGKQIDKK